MNFFRPSLRRVLRQARDHLVDEAGSRAIRVALDLLHHYIETETLLLDREAAVRGVVRTVYHVLDEGLRRQVPLALHRVRELLGNRLTARDRGLFEAVDEVVAQHRAPPN